MANAQLSTRAISAEPVSATPHHLLCSACQKPVLNAFQTPHGCRLCQSCYSQLPQDEKTICPGKTDACKDPEEEIHISQSTCTPDIASRREVGRLPVFCPNKQDGCDWRGKWKDVDAHLSACKFQRVQCDLCNEWVMQKKLEHHKKKECEKRMVKCEMCSEQVAFCDLSSAHRNLEAVDCCPKFKAACPYCRDEGNQLDRNGFVRHIEHCPEKPQKCRFAHLGCNFKAKESELTRHYKEDAHEHVELIDKRLRMQGQAPTAIQPPVTQVVAASEPSIQQKDLEKKFATTFDMFKKLQVNVANWAHTAIELESAMESFGGLNQMQSFLRDLQNRLAGSDVGSGPASARGADYSALNAQLNSIEKRVKKLEGTSFDGNFTWKIENWEGKRLDHVIKSPAFYTHKFGYKLRLRLYPGGQDGNSSLMLLQLSVEQHGFDDTLQWPVKGEFAVRLVCPGNRSNDVQFKSKFDCERPLGTDSSPCLNLEKFAQKAQFESAGFVKDSSCYIVCSAQIAKAGDEKRRKR